MPNLIKHTATIVAAYLANNTVERADVGALIADVHSALSSCDGTPVAETPEPAVPISKSITPDYLICLEDGKQLKMLKRHLRTSYNLSPDDYRKRWGLPADYPMVCVNYAKRRTEIAKETGLGTVAVT